MKIAITGHRPNKLDNDYDLNSSLIQKIKYKIYSVLIDKKVLSDHKLMYCGDGKDALITGMALGIDTLFAKIAVNNGIPFIAAIPDQSQSNRWSKKSKLVYYDLLKKASKIVNVSGEILFKMEHLQQRNEWMVDNCDLLIAVWDGTPGGTANCVEYAKEKNREIVYIDPNNYRKLIHEH